MGLFAFLIVMLAAAWGIVWQLNDTPPAPPTAPIARHVAPQPKPVVPEPVSAESATAAASATAAEDGISETPAATKESGSPY